MSPGFLLTRTGYRPVQPSLHDWSRPAVKGPFLADRPGVEMHLL